jgi:hypothetical protein
MKKLILTAAMVSLMSTQGCIWVSDASYAEKTAMWQAKEAAAISWNSRQAQPLATFTTASGETFTVNNPNQAQPMAVVGEPSAIVQGANVILNSTVAKIVGGGWAAGYMLGKVQGSYSTGDHGSINVTRDSGNTVDIETRHIEEGGTISEETHTGSDYTADSHDAVSDPMVVSAPDPVIVTVPDPVIVTVPDPVIVRPEVVRTEIVVVGGDQ